MTDLRTLAQAVVDAHAASDHDMIVEAYDALYQGLGAPYDGDTSKRILAALNAERAQGYARAMGEVVERCEAGMSHHGGYLSPRSRGVYHAFEDVADWARERLPAAAERD